MNPVHIGILSDTHLAGPSDSFNRTVQQCFKGASIILHAGDLTDLSILKAFAGKEIHAVHGNMCNQQTASSLPTQKIVTINNYRIGLIHSVGWAYDFEDRLIDQFDEVDCIVYGHTHRAKVEQIGDILYINPGSFVATGRYGAPGTFALLEAGETLKAQIYEVPTP